MLHCPYYFLLSDKLLLLYSCVGNEDGNVCSQCTNPAVPEALLMEILELRERGVSVTDVVDRLYPRTVPTRYTYYPWIAGNNYSLYG